MADDICPDKAMIIELLLELQKLYKIKLFESLSTKEVLKFCLHAIFHVISFGRGFRGEEMPILIRDAMAKYLAYEQPSNSRLAHVVIALGARVKDKRKAEVCHLVPIVMALKSCLKPKL